MGDCPHRVIGQANDIVELIWTPVDLNDQSFQVNVGDRLSSNCLLLWFKGTAGASVSIEVIINYELIPTGNLDILNATMSRSGNPTVAMKALSDAMTLMPQVSASTKKDR